MMYSRLSKVRLGIAIGLLFLGSTSHGEMPAYSELLQAAAALSNTGATIANTNCLAAMKKALRATHPKKKAEYAEQAQLACSQANASQVAATQNNQSAIAEPTETATGLLGTASALPLPPPTTVAAASLPVIPQPITNSNATVSQPAAESSPPSLTQGVPAPSVILADSTASASPMWSEGTAAKFQSLAATALKKEMRSEPPVDAAAEGTADTPTPNSEIAPLPQNPPQILPPLEVAGTSPRTRKMSIFVYAKLRLKRFKADSKTQVVADSSYRDRFLSPQ